MPTKNTTTQEDVRRFHEIKDEITELLYEAEKIIRSTGNQIEIERMKSYWLASIKMALDNDHDYLGKDMFTMDSSAGFLESIVEDDEDDDDDDEEEDEENVF